jgi:hypothetical protein
MLIYAPKALTHKQREYAKHPRKKICRRAENTIGTTHYHFIPENPCNQHHNRKWFADPHKQKLTQVHISNFHTCTSTLAKQKANSCPTSMNRVSRGTIHIYSQHTQAQRPGTGPWRSRNRHEAEPSTGSWPCGRPGRQRGCCNPIRCRTKRQA